MQMSHHNKELKLFFDIFDRLSARYYRFTYTIAID